MIARLWSVTLDAADAAAAASLAAGLDDLVQSTAYFRVEPGTGWRIEAIAEAPPDRALLARCLGAAADRAVVAPLPDIDWLAENRRQFPPVRVGRIFVHASSYRGVVPAGAIAIELDAGLAFGSGTHESTRGCLLALDRLARRRDFTRPLDLGCGSGILAIAMARRWRVPVAAADIDPVAVAVARANARRNRVAALVRPVVSAGLAARSLRGAARYDLIVANILARPLQILAPALARAAAPGARLVLSGLTRDQAAGVVAACRAQRLRLRGRVRLGDWETLVVERRGRSRPATRTSS